MKCCAWELESLLDCAIERAHATGGLDPVGGQHATERWHLLANHLEGETIRYSELFSALRVSVERTVEVLAELDRSTTTGYRP
ncbi:MAG TPA: hypothetical protein VFQ48_11550 [Pseudonocardiaceae bacterium]|nr:hypothetical protein [Pseudonocardiaceae bacterium]